MRVADAALGEAMRRDPVAIEPYSFRGDLLLLVGRTAEAVQAYERAAAHELRAEILLHQGIALWKLGRQEEGVVQMRRGVALAPPLASALPPEARERVAEEPVRPLPER
jgi:tetratricopeptide (TPR) repeat protein